MPLSARRGATALVGALAMIGCGGAAAPLPPDVAARIVTGTTSLAELREELGEPATIDVSTRGTTATWHVVEASTFGADRVRRLVVDAAPSGVVRSFEYESNVPSEAP